MSEQPPTDRVSAYQVLSSPFTVNLADAVNTAIRDGWQPLGGICVDAAGNGEFHQAIVKYAK